MDIWQYIIHPRDVWGHLSRYLKQGGHAAVQREVVRSLRLRARDVVLDLGGGGHAHCRQLQSHRFCAQQYDQFSYSEGRSVDSV